MHEFALEFTPRALHDLDRLERPAQEPIIARLDELEANPFLRGKHIKKLKEMDLPTYRLRVDSSVGSFRVFYRFRGMIILVLRIVAKKDADRIIRGL